jgi:hypothetical protein
MPAAESPFTGKHLKPVFNRGYGASGHESLSYSHTIAFYSAAIDDFVTVASTFELR